MQQSVAVRALAALALAAALAGPGILAADEGWQDTAEFSLVSTGGNTESVSLGLKNTLWREWEKSKFTVGAGAIVVDSTVDRYVPQGTTDIEFVTDKTAESYYLNGRYDRNISDRFFWYGGAGWDRNEFAGIQDRYIGEGGVGNIWSDTDDLKFSTRYGLTYTKQEDVVSDAEKLAAGVPINDDTYIGWRAAWDYLNKLGTNTTYTNVFLVDGNLDETSDWRMDMDNGLTVAMTARMALKVGLRFLYDNDPSYETLTVKDTAGTPVGTATVQLDELDTILTASLVVNF